MSFRHDWDVLKNEVSHEFNQVSNDLSYSGNRLMTETKYELNGYGDDSVVIGNAVVPIGLVIGLVVGGCVLFCLIVICCCCCKRTTRGRVLVGSPPPAPLVPQVLIHQSYPEYPPTYDTDRLLRTDVK